MDWYTGKIVDPLMGSHEITLGGQKFTVAPFKLKDWIALAPARKSMREAEDDSIDQFIGRIAIVHMALAINYPDLKPQDLIDNFKPEDLNPALQAVVEANEFIRAARGEVTAPLNGATETKTGLLS